MPENQNEPTNLRKLRFRAGRIVINHPVLARPYMRLRKPYEPYRFKAGVRLVIDGFPRSANTYAWFAAKHVLTGPDDVRGHTHSPATLLAGVSHGVPTILTLRNPDDAIASYVQMARGSNIEQAFNAYAAFHRPLVRYASHLTIAPFEQVVSDFGQVLERAGRNHGVDFPTFHNTPEDKAAVKAAVEHSTAVIHAGKDNEMRVPRPSATRRSASAVLAELSTAEERARQRARHYYATLLPHADR